MNTSKLSIASFLFVFLIFSCQDSKVGDPVTPKSSPGKEAGARRACSNEILYSWIFPSDDYTYNGNGCVTYYIHRVSARQIKLKMANTSGITQTMGVFVEYPDNPLNFSYAVYSVTGGTTTYLSSSPSGGYGKAIRWKADNMPAYTTYELTLSIYGEPGGSSAENGVSIYSEFPCDAAPSTDCSSDENLHLVLSN